jgi:hypothetical protein
LKDSRFSYDACVYWRVALDRDLFQETRALPTSIRRASWLSTAWAKDHKLAASISKTGKPLVDYESLEMLSGLAAPKDQSMSAELNPLIQTASGRTRQLHLKTGPGSAGLVSRLFWAL